MENLAVKLSAVHVSYGAKDVLTIDHLAAYENERIGIIGSNGQGKSTLLKLIAGKLKPEQGKIQQEVSFCYFPQIAELDAFNESEQLDMALMSRLHVPDNEAETLSGGEKTKFRLAQVLSIYEPGLLLDEPTTHLDKTSVETLVEELRYYYGTLIFVSHDRYFLNQLADKIWEVANGKVTEYNGNYDAYLQQKEQETLEQERNHEQYLKEKRRLESAVQKKKEQAKEAGKASVKKKKQNVRPDRLSSSKQKDTVEKNLQKSAKALASRLTQLEEVKDVETKRKIVFPTSKAIEMHNKYPIRGEQVTLIRGTKQLLLQAGFQFPLGKKIAITGDNGTGKTTLLRHILNDGAGIILSPNVKFATYQQMDYKLSGNESVLKFLMKQTEYKEPLVRSILHNLRFSQEEILKPVSKLSGGEATRLSIALMFVKPANVLVLDEPTNFIDLDTLNALEDFLKAYPGMVLFTSHDPYFVAEVADEVYTISEKKLMQASFLSY